MSETRDLSYWKCGQCSTAWGQNRTAAEGCCETEPVYVACRCSRCVEAYQSLHIERSEPAAASVPLLVNADELANALLAEADELERERMGPGDMRDHLTAVSLMRSAAQALGSADSLAAPAVSREAEGAQDWDNVFTPEDGDLIAMAARYTDHEQGCAYDWQKAESVCDCGLWELLGRLAKRLALAAPAVSREASVPQGGELNVLLYGDKDSSTIHYDEDTIPHGACSDPLHCDCMCPRCWRDKVKIIERALSSAPGEREGR